jgi:rhamnose transport system permease protein
MKSFNQFSEKQVPVSAVRSRNILRDLLLSQEAILLLILILAVILLSTQNERFLQSDNLLNQGRLLTEVALVALPMTFIIITGGIDLSVGSTFGLSAVMLWFAWQRLNLPLEIAIGVALLTGVICGFVNGLLIVRVGIPPLIMTLATLALYRGLALGISQARQARGFPDWFYQLGQGELGGVPTQLWLVVVAVIITGIVLARTPFGRSIYAIGNNELGARFSGIPVDRYKLIIYALSGFTAALAGYIFVSRVSTTRSDMGTGLELDAIAAVVLGGTSIFGGSGSIAGTVIGLVLIQLLKNGLLLADVKGDATTVVVGIVLILAVLVNSVIQRVRNAT